PGGVHTAGDRRRLRCAVGACGDEHGVMTRPDEVEQLLARHGRVRRDVRAHAVSSGRAAGPLGPAPPRLRPGPGFVRRYALAPSRRALPVSGQGPASSAGMPWLPRAGPSRSPTRARLRPQVCLGSLGPGPPGLRPGPGFVRTYALAPSGRALPVSDQGPASSARILGSMAPQFIFTMRGLSRFHPPDRQVLENINISMY